ncbi:MAG: tRNA dihydrouridine(20/20a) synthase DusA, partial [Pseudomonadota bacterium]
NINVGCPSDRVQSGQFGACLMARPELVADCVAAMQARVRVPVTVKTRIGIDDKDSDEFFMAFVERVAEAGCDTFIVHARIAILAGLSPKQNREVPPLNYPRVHRLKAERPELTVVINGGLRTLDDVDGQRGHVDGVMIGRAAYQTPYFLVVLERALANEHHAPTRRDIMSMLVSYVREQQAAGIPLRAVARHTLGLFQGQPGARRFRRALSEGMHHKSADVGVLEEALAQLGS